MTVTQPTGEQNASPTIARWSIYTLMILVVVGLVTARIMRNRSPDAFSPTPFQSANDKSRWCTIRALGDHGVYSIEHLIFYDDGQRVRDWHTIDLVRHRGPDGREHYYSSKPTLLSTLLAGQYWLVKKATGLSLASPPQVWFVVRLMLVLTNVVPLAIALAILARLIDRFGRTDWGRLFAFGCAAFGTFVTTYSTTLNNHSLAACTVVFGLAAAIPIWQGGGRWWHFGLAGLFFALTAANELPALSLLVLAAAALAGKSPAATAIAFAPAALLVASAAIGTNYYAHGDWRTPYAHRQDGPVIGMLPDQLAAPLNEGRFTDELKKALREQGVSLSDSISIEIRTPGERWELFDEATHHRFALARTPEGSRLLGIEIRRWGNWYDYPGTHWDPMTVTGLDRGEPSPSVYAFHCLIGHHGLFSLTPIWLMTVGGCGAWLRRGDATARALSVATIAITLVVLAFYLSRDQIDRNYGGGTCCLRWLIWLTPLWLLTLLPAADWLGRSRWGQALALILLAVSAFSAQYAADNPWADPWLFNWLEWQGWIQY
jgi:hypothetical protein